MDEKWNNEVCLKLLYNNYELVFIIAINDKICNVTI